MNDLILAVYLMLAVYIVCHRFGKLEVETARFDVVPGGRTSAGKTVVQPEQT